MGYLIALVLIVAISAFAGMALMLGMGLLHHEISESIPALGFWVSWGIMAVASVILTLLKPQR